MSEYTIKEYTGKIKDKDGKNDKFEIVKFETKEPKMVIDKDGKGKANVKATIKKIDDKGNAGKEETNKDIEIEYEQGTFVHYGKIKKVDGEEVQTVDVGFTGMSFRWTFYVGIGATLVIIGALIWWLVASSKSEDKEEEGL